MLVNASPDNEGMQEVLATYADPRIKTIDFPEHLGIAGNTNIGIRAATGDYAAFADHDDTLSPYVPERYMAFAAQCPDADLFYCDEDNFEKDDAAGYAPRFKPDFNRDLQYSYNYVVHMLMVSRYVLGRVELSGDEMSGAQHYDPSLVISEDPGRPVELNGAPWNKAFRASLLKNMRDLENPPTVPDDLAFHLLVFLGARGKVAFSDKALIIYMVRSDSIINTVRKEQIDSIYSTFEIIRASYREAGASKEMMEALDGMAFLHLGVSLLFRLFSDPSCDASAYIRRCTTFLDENFPTWRSSACMSFACAQRHRGSFLKLWVARLFYKAHLMKPLLGAYRFTIEKLRIDIKW